MTDSQKDRAAAMDSMAEELEAYLQRLKDLTVTFQELFAEQCEKSDLLKTGTETIHKVLNSAQDYIDVVEEHGDCLSDLANLVPALNFLAIVPVLLTGIKYVAMAWDMLEADKGKRKSAQVKIKHSIDRLQTRFEIIEKWVDELGSMVGVMKVLHHERANRELDNLIILFDEKLRLIKSDVDECNRQLQGAKATIDEEIKKLNTRIPIAATVAGILGVAGLGIAGVILTPVGVGVPMIVGAAAGGAALVGSGTVAAVAAVQYSKIRDKFFTHLAQQKMLCDDMERVTQQVREHAQTLKDRGIRVESPWMITLNWSLVANYKCISQLPEPDEPAADPKIVAEKGGKGNSTWFSQAASPLSS